MSELDPETTAAEAEANSVTSMHSVNAMPEVRVVVVLHLFDISAQMVNRVFQALQLCHHVTDVTVDLAMSVGSVLS